MALVVLNWMLPTFTLYDLKKKNIVWRFVSILSHLSSQPILFVVLWAVGGPFALCIVVQIYVYGFK